MLNLYITIPCNKMKRILIYFACYGFLILCVRAENFNFTNAMIMRCKEHSCRHGYLYETFYQVDSLQKPKSNGAALEMHIAILAGSNGHILLSPVLNPNPATDDVYEIVVGGGGNKFTELRRNLRRNAKVSTKTVNILSAIDFTAFYIRISEDGLIEFGKEGDPLPLLSYTDVRPLVIRYFSFAAWNGVEAKFLYDCPPPGDNGTTVSPDSEEVERNMTNVEKLKWSLLGKRDLNMAPHQNVTVKLDIRVTSVNYNAFDGKLTTGIAFVVVWDDDTLSWSPEKFDNITNLKFRQGVLWRPTFYVLNSHDMGLIESRDTELISINSNGETSFHFYSKINSWCNEIDKINRWPNDEYTCTVLIGAWEPHEIIQLEGLYETNNRLYALSDIDDEIVNGWDMFATFHIVPMVLWQKLFTPPDESAQLSDKLMLTITVKRQATALNIVFYTPLIVLVIFVLLSFWNKPLEMSRIWFYAGCAVIISILLAYVDFFMPCHSVPSILILYSTVLFGVLIALILKVVLMTSRVERLCKTSTVQSLLTTKWLRIVFCLPVIKTCNHYESINEAYASQEDDESGAIIAPSNQVEEMQTDATTYCEREEIAQILDKLLFFIYSVTFAVMLGLHY